MQKRKNKAGNFHEKFEKKKIKIKNFQKFFWQFPEFFQNLLKKTVLIRKIVLFVHFKKPY